LSQSFRSGPLRTGRSARVANLRFTLAIWPLQRFGRLDDVVVVATGSEWRGVAVADRVEPKPSAPPPKDDAQVIVVVASHAVALPELPVVVIIVNKKGHALSPDHVGPFASGNFAVKLNCTAVSRFSASFGFG
jgi:hypothetical protein